MTKKYRLVIETNTEKEDADSYTCYNRTEIDTLVEVDSVLTARDLLNRYNLIIRFKRGFFYVIQSFKKIKKRK